MEHLVNLNLKPVWEEFERGDGLTLSEVRSLIKQTEAALPYLRARSRVLGTAVTADAVVTLNRLREFEAAMAKREKKPA